jgi:hypothetical protein
VYVRILTQFVPHELQLEHANSIKQMTDEQLEAAIEMLQGMIAGANAKLVEGVAEPAALPALSRKPRRKRGAEATASPLLLDE